MSDRAGDVAFKVGLEHIESGTGQLIESEADFEGVGVAFQAGDVLYGKLRPYLAKAWVADRPGSAVGDFLVLRPESGIEPRYLRDALLDRAAVDWVSASVFGSKMPRTNWETIGQLPIRLIPFREQVRMGQHLDRETAEIDAFIADQEELITLLAERRAAVLLDNTLSLLTVTRTRIGRLLVLMDRAVSGSSIVTAFRDGQVTARSARREDGFTESSDQSGYQGVLVGDLVFHGLDGFAGAVGISEADGQCSPVYHVCSAANESVWLPYMALHLRALGASGFLEAYAWSVRQRAVDYRNWDTFGHLPISIPPIEEQQAAVARFTSETSEIDAAIADAREAIALSKERRAALISAAVTGKLDLGA